MKTNWVREQNKKSKKEKEWKKFGSDIEEKDWEQNINLTKWNKHKIKKELNT